MINMTCSVCSIERNPSSERGSCILVAPGYQHDWVDIMECARCGEESVNPTDTLCYWEGRHDWQPMPFEPSNALCRHCNKPRSRHYMNEAYCGDGQGSQFEPVVEHPFKVGDQIRNAATGTVFVVLESGDLGFAYCLPERTHAVLRRGWDEREGYELVPADGPKCIHCGQPKGRHSSAWSHCPNQMGAFSPERSFKPVSAPDVALSLLIADFGFRLAIYVEIGKGQKVFDQELRHGMILTPNMPFEMVKQKIDALVGDPPVPRLEREETDRSNPIYHFVCESNTFVYPSWVIRDINILAKQAGATENLRIYEPQRPAWTELSCGDPSIKMWRVVIK